MKISRKLLLILSLGMFLGTFGIVIFPSPAFANAGTALMWTGVIQLLIGNAVIGYIEGGLLAKLFHTSRVKATSVLIIANYTSAWGGMFLLLNYLSKIPNVTILNVRIWLYLSVVLAFILTLLIEYPFFWFLLRQNQNAVKKAVRATLIIHGISYLLLFGWYGLSSRTSMLTQLEVVPLQQLYPSQEYTLYFITPDGKQAVRSNLQGKHQETIKFSDFESLSLQRGSNFGPVPKLTEDTSWDYYAHVWAAGGITGFNHVENLKFSFSLETPFTLWRVSNATHLQGDFVVFQLGSDQLCILQPQQRKIALIARGKKPIVVRRT